MMTRSEERDWNEWCDQRCQAIVANVMDTVVDALGQESGALEAEFRNDVRQMVTELREEIAELRTMILKQNGIADNVIEMPSYRAGKL